MLVILTLLLFALLLLVYIRNRLTYYNNLPPGPPAVPILGSFPFLKGNGAADKLTHVSLERYGRDFVTLWLGSNLTIMIQDISITKDLFSKDAFSSRPTSWFTQVGTLL